MINSASIQWVVQKNLTNYNDFSALESACRELKIPFVGINVIPFSNELPDFYRKPKNIFYGSTTFNNLAYSNKDLNEGVFFNPSTFSIERYIQEWGEHMLNYGAVVTTFEELTQTEYDPEKMLFIVECNCMNAAGFYDADIEAIVTNVTDYVSGRTNYPLS